MRRLSLLLIAALALPAAAPPPSPGACAPGIAQAERASHLPPQILPTLALVESGRAVGGRVQPWPWTINVNGEGHFYETKADAIAAVQTFQAAGAKSIDVGCMQINLAMHPNAFASLDDAFDPTANTRYGAQFLLALYTASGRWGTAITAYHSSTPIYAADYARKILAVWPGAAALGLVTTAPAGPASPDTQAGHDYTEAFAMQVAADMAARRARTARIAPPIAIQAATTPSTHSLLRLATADQRHGPAWPRGVP